MRPGCTEKGSLYVEFQTYDEADVAARALCASRDFARRRLDDPLVGAVDQLTRGAENMLIEPGLVVRLEAGLAGDILSALQQYGSDSGGHHALLATQMVRQYQGASGNN